MKTVLNFCDEQVFHDTFVHESATAKEAMIAMFNTILERKNNPIVETKLRNSFLSKQKEPGVLLDFDAKSANGELFEITVICGNPSFYHFYSKACSDRHMRLALDSRRNHDGKHYIVITFVNGIVYPSTDELHLTFQLREKEMGFPLYERMVQHVIELEKVPLHKLVADMSKIEQMAAYLKYRGDASKEPLTQELLLCENDAIQKLERI